MCWTTNEYFNRQSLVSESESASQRCFCRGVGPCLERADGNSGPRPDFALPRYHCRHFVHNLPSENFMDSLSSLVKFSEEPLVEPAAVALYRLAELARSKVKVLLSGAGSDEILGGGIRFINACSN